MDIHPNILGVIHEGAPCCRLRCERSKPTPNGRPFIMRLPDLGCLCNIQTTKMLWATGGPLRVNESGNPAKPPPINEGGHWRERYNCPFDRYRGVFRFYSLGRYSQGAIYDKADTFDIGGLFFFVRGGCSKRTDSAGGQRTVGG